MSLFLALAGGGVGLPHSASAVPVVAIGKSGDEWERYPTEEFAANHPPCKRLPDHQVSFLSNEADAAELLEASVLLLEESAAAQKLGYGTGLNTTSAERAASEAIRQMEAQRLEVFRTRRGSWSVADENELDRVRLLRSSGQITQYRPYLVRAFRWRGGQAHLGVDLCGGYIRTMVVSDRRGRQPKPERAAAIVFLPAAPEGSFALWAEEILPESR